MHTAVRSAGAGRGEPGRDASRERSVRKDGCFSSVFVLPLFREGPCTPPGRDAPERPCGFRRRFRKAGVPDRTDGFRPDLKNCSAMKRIFATLLFVFAACAAGAREVYPLNEGWRFFFKSENTSDNARHVTLPHTWNTDPRSAGGWLETTGNYQNDIYIPGEWASRRLFVKFYGAQSVADLFVNGRHAGTHRGGAAAFAFEITDYVRFGEDNALLVVVSNGVRDDVLPTSTDMNLSLIHI